MTFNAAAAYLDEALRSFRGHKRLAEGAIAQLSDAELFALIDPEANSIAIVVKHMAGNMRSRWTDFLTTDGDKPNRHRDTEFEMQPGTTRAELMRWWEEAWALVFKTIESLKPEDLVRTVYIRGQEHTVLQAINRQVTHYAYHVGQIVLLAKHARGAEWKSLSIPKGQSEAVGKQAEAAHKQRREG
jgi:uncharacterized damage-inducible protein DinB